MGMREIEEGKNIPYIDGREEGLRKKVNDFFGIAKDAMNRSRWAHISDFIHVIPCFILSRMRHPALFVSE